MRKFRTAAIASATALAVAFGGTTAAVAEDTNNFTDDLKNFVVGSSEKGSSAWGFRYDGHDTVTGEHLFGQVKDWAAQPQWAKMWYGAGIAGIIGSILGLIYLPLANHAKAMGWII